MRERMVYTRDNVLPFKKPPGGFGAADRGGYSPVSGDARLSFFSLALLVCTSIPVSRKKFLTFGRISLLLFGGRERGLVARTSTHASWSDPTLSARCDGSQLLLGLALRKEGSPIEDYPRHHHQSCVWRFGCAVCRCPGVVHIQVKALDNLISASSSIE
jgi:hypothetical protein